MPLPAQQVEEELPSFILPVRGVMLKKHDPSLQVYSTTMGDYRVHLGVDIATLEGAPVYAAADGTVKRIWKDALMGYCVAIEHSGESISVYKNLSDVLPSGIIEGAKVKAGQQIASVGESAMVEIADEPHLHFELSVEAEYVDPTEYFDSASVAVLDQDTAYEG